MLPAGYATDDGVALHRVIAETSGKYAYHVARTSTGAEETRIEPELLG